MVYNVLAAGTIPWRIRKNKLEVLLVHRPRYKDWAWPKGKLDPGESLTSCAVRETQEETGVTVRLGQPLGTLSYPLAPGRRKVIHYWAGAPISEKSGAVAARGSVSPASKHEIDDARWVTVKEAYKLLTYLRDREPLDLLVDQYDNGRLDTWTFAVVRHGQAMKRTVWKRQNKGINGAGNEVDRPLTPTGRAQANELVPILAAYGIEDVLTSPWKRCTATVRPYTKAAGIKAVWMPEVTESAHEENPKAVRQIVENCLSTVDEPVALCTHRPVLPTVFESITRYAPRRIQRYLPQEDPWLRPGHVLVLHMAHRREGEPFVVASEIHVPPVRS